ncbi:hypothetical protein FRC02_006060 [Tulasnella sp. 418]|nr:hypothetical protein FRC02_006060 [Tulasnella sp. 418]
MMLIGKAFKKIKEPASKDLKIMLFSDERIKSICMEPRTNTTETALQLSSILAPSKSDDRELASPFASYWASMVMDSLNPEIIGHASQWVPFMPTKDLTACFDRVLWRYLNTPTSSHLEFIKSTLSSILALPPTNSVSIISSRFLTLLQLRHIKELQNTISTALKFVLEQSTPFGVCVHESKIGEPLSTVIPLGIRRWSARSRQSLSNVHLSLEGSDGPEHWDDVDVKIASALLYGSQSIRRNMSEYFSGKTAQWVDTPSPTLLPVIHAFLDVTNACQEVDSLPEIEGISGCFNSLINSIMSPSTESMLRKLAAESAVMLIQMLKSRHGEFNKVIASAIEDAPNSTALDREVLWFVEAVATLGNGAFNDTVDVCAESGLKWVVRRFAEDPSDSSYFLICLHRFGEVLKRTQSIKSYIAEPVLTAAAKHRVKSREALEFVAILARHVQLKASFLLQVGAPMTNIFLQPVNTNRLIQALVQHPSLNSAPKGPLTAFLHALFTSHPSNTCQPSQVTPLIRLYRGTQSVSDRRLLSIFQLFETERRVSIASLMNRWNEVSGTISQSAYEALTSMDPAMMFRTCTSFPQRQSTVLHASSITETYHDTQSSLYDPIFVLTFAGSCLVDEQSQPKTALEWVEFFRTNVGSLAMSALSSKEVGMRKLGGSVLRGLWRAINNASFQERDQAVYIIGLLKNLLEPPSASETSAYPPRLPTYTTLVLSHALHAVFYPSTFLYPIVSRFLLQRPQLDAKDVPMLYGMLYSSSINTGGTPADSEIERNWMIRFLADGMRSTADWKVLKRRHTWDLLATMFQSGVRDRDGTLRLSILQVLLRLTSNQEAVTSLVLHSGLLSWMEMQILHSSSAAPFRTVMSYQQKEHVAWMQVLDHIVWTLNWEKVRKAGGRCWIESIGRCLIGLTDWGIRSIDVLLIACRVLTRLSTVSPDEPLATSTTRQIGSLVEAILNQLQKGEGELISSVASSDFDQSLVHWVFPHSMAGEIKKRDKSGLSARDATSPCQDDLSVWGECISLLWRIVMELNLGPKLWDALTVRILIWYVLRQKSYGDVWDPNSPGEWARRQVIACMAE